MTTKTPRLMWIPAPGPLEGALRTEADIALHRRLYCGHYDGCLGRSVREGWAGFTCMHCPLRDQAARALRLEPFADRQHSEHLDL